MDWQDRIERSFGEGPATRDVRDHLHAGRRAVRRRSITTAVGTLVVLAAVGGAFGAVSTAGSAPRPSLGAADPTPSAAENFRWRDQDPIPQFRLAEDTAFYDVDSELVIRPGADIVRTMDNPARLRPPGVSTGLVISSAGTTYWTYAYFSGNGGQESGSTSVEASQVRGGPPSSSGSRTRWPATRAPAAVHAMPG